ncbi:MAG: (2Fe-2S)-binding protein [Deltaproteobacteria bacterium]|nr:(2Fe-2S)-binding protein [Deltaproteobacteria bacterium]
MGKKIVCFCHDITESDIISAIDAGYNNIEMLKRFTGVFMGPCQGKMCMQNVLKIFAQKTGQPIENMRVPTLRPPVEPIPLGALATETLRGEDET